MTTTWTSWRAVCALTSASDDDLVGDQVCVVERLGVKEMLVSISHCRSHATAYALAIGEN